MGNQEQGREAEKRPEEGRPFCVVWGPTPMGMEARRWTLASNKKEARDRIKVMTRIPPNRILRVEPVDREEFIKQVTRLYKEKGVKFPKDVLDFCRLKGEERGSGRTSGQRRKKPGRKQRRAKRR